MENANPRLPVTALLIAGLFAVVLPIAAHAGCKADYADAVDSCRAIYDEPDDADDLALCVQSAKDDFDACVE